MPISDVQSFVAVAAATQALQGVAFCLKALGNVDECHVMARNVVQLTQELSLPGQQCQQLLRTLLLRCHSRAMAMAAAAANTTAAQPLPPKNAVLIIWRERLAPSGRSSWYMVVVINVCDQIMVFIQRHSHCCLGFGSVLLNMV